MLVGVRIARFVEKKFGYGFQGRRCCLYTSKIRAATRPVADCAFWALRYLTVSAHGVEFSDWPAAEWWGRGCGT